MGELLPCPLCGATPHRGPGKVENCQLHGEPFQRYSIWCPHQHAKVTAQSEDAAQAAWNTRTPDARITQLEAEKALAVEALEWAEVSLQGAGNVAGAPIALNKVQATLTRITGEA